MSELNDGDGILRELKIEVEAELALAESSHPEEITGPITEWPYDPMDAQREQIGLRNLLGAIEAVQGDGPNGDRSTGS